MNDADRLRLIGDTIRQLQTLTPISTGITAGRDARRRAARAQSHGLGSGHGGGQSAGGELGYSDPCGTAVDATADRARRVEEELRRDDEALVQAANLIAAVATRNAVALRPPKDPRPTQKPKRCCESCARAGLEVDIYIDRYAKFCRWCGEYRAAEGRVPPVEACRWKETHGKNPRPDQVARWLAEEKLPSRVGRLGA